MDKLDFGLASNSSSLSRITSVNGSTISKIGPGLVALIGIGVGKSVTEVDSLENEKVREDSFHLTVLRFLLPETDDSHADITSLAAKILNLRIWNDNETAEALKTNASSNPSPTEVGSIASTTANATSNDQSQVSGKEDVDTELKVDNLELTQKSRSEEVWGGVPWKSSVMAIGGEILCSE